jgi:hypothetical protein
MPNHVELEDFLSPERIEYAHGLCAKYQAMGRQEFAAAGWRAAQARDPKLLKALERGAEVIDKLTENQYGRTMRGSSATFGETKGTTEAQLWRNAYTTLDNGTPEQNYEWIYGAAAWLCGYGS